MEYGQASNLVHNAIVSTSDKMTSYTILLSKIVVEGHGKKFYQQTTLRVFTSSKQTLENNSHVIVKIVCHFVEHRCTVIKIQYTKTRSLFECHERLEMWSKTFSVDNTEDYQNVFCIVELLPITPFSNAQLELVFS